MEGDGKFTWPTRYVYIGEFKNDQQNGIGVLTTAHLDEYTSDFVNGKMQEYGIMQYANNNIKIGQMMNNQANGEGMYIWKEGIRIRQYFGGFRDGKW